MGVSEVAGLKGVGREVSEVIRVWKSVEKFFELWRSGA